LGASSLINLLERELIELLDGSDDDDDDSHIFSNTLVSFGSHLDDDLHSFSIHSCTSLSPRGVVQSKVKDDLEEAKERI